MSKIKICGLKRIEDIDFANIVKPDYIGFVFAGQKRKITFEKALELRKLLNKDIDAVGVFVNEKYENIVKMAKANIIQIVQLHGNEQEEYIRLLRKNINIPIIKAFRIENNENVEIAKKSIADYILLDNGDGGTGRCFSWNNIKNIDRKFFLAGGINSENIEQALKFNPYVIDVSSGVETNGIKDFDKMKYIVSKVKNETYGGY